MSSAKSVLTQWIPQQWDQNSPQPPQMWVRMCKIFQSTSLFDILFLEVSTSNRLQPNVPGSFADIAVKTSNGRDWQLHTFRAVALEVSNRPDLPSNHQLWPESSRQTDTPPARFCSLQFIQVQLPTCQKNLTYTQNNNRVSTVAFVQSDLNTSW